MAVILVRLVLILADPLVGAELPALLTLLAKLREKALSRLSCSEDNSNEGGKATVTVVALPSTTRVDLPMGILTKNGIARISVSSESDELSEVPLEGTLAACIDSTLPSDTDRRSLDAKTVLSVPLSGG